MCLLDSWPLSCLSIQLLHMIFGLHFNHQDFLKPASLPWEAPRVSCQVHGTDTWLTAVRWGTKDTLQHLAQSMPFTVLSSEVCLPFRYPCSDWWRQLEGGPSHCLYHISNTWQAFEAGSYALQLKQGPFRLVMLYYLQCHFSTKTKFLAHIILVLIKSQIWILGAVTKLWIKSLQALWYRLNVPKPIGN